MPHRLAVFLALPLIALSGVAAAKRHPAQRTMHPRIAVHYYRAKPPHRTFTQGPHHPRQERG